LITQNPMTSLDPMLRVGAQIDQISTLHRGLSASAARERSIELLTQLRIPDARTVHGQYPHQMSGGMKQRVVIAMALAAEPDLIIADEPTTALDVTIQAQIIQILVDLVRQRGLALMLITHDMGVVAQACDEVVVLYAGRIAESNQVEGIFAEPAHPYTRALIDCIPRGGQASGSLTGIAGIVPSVANYSSGCRYHPRCSLAQARCANETPVLQTTGKARVACHFARQGGPHD
jgi:peptide/nickel transport system ATP-binding protein